MVEKKNTPSLSEAVPIRMQQESGLVLPLPKREYIFVLGKLWWDCKDKSYQIRPQQSQNYKLRGLASVRLELHAPIIVVQV